MSASDVQSEILDPMQRLFLPPRRLEPGEEQAVLREYVRALEGFDADTLRLAWFEIVETHTSRSWPLPAACIKAAKDAARERRMASQPKKGEGPAPKTEAELKWDRWVIISRSEMAREAARRGCAWSLKCAVLDDGKLPEQIDIRELTLAKTSAERTAAKIQSGELRFREDNQQAALNLWRAQLQREAQTRDEINYGKAA